MYHCGIRSMLAEQVANICRDVLVSVAEDADGNADAGDAKANICGDGHEQLRDTLYAEPKPARAFGPAGNGNAVQCMGDGGAGACPRFTSLRSNLTSQLKFNYKNYMNLIEVYCLGF